MQTTKWWVGLLVMAAGCVGASASNDEPTGSAVAYLTSVPSGVQCARLTLRGTGTLYPLTPGAGTALNLGPLPSGTMLVSAQAFNAACASVSASTVPSWVSEPVNVTVTAGLTASFSLTLRPNVGTSASLDFVLPAVAIAAGATTTYAVMQDGTVRAWGKNLYGQIGDGTTTDRTTPVAITALSGVRQVAGGRAHACAITQSGVTLCWGNNDHSQSDPYDVTGTGTAPRTTPVTIYDNGARMLAAGDNHTASLLGDGSVSCWGDNSSSQCGPTASNPAATRVLAAYHGYGLGATWRGNMVVAGADFTCVAVDSGGVECVGANTVGQLGRSGPGSVALGSPAYGIFVLESTFIGVVGIAARNQETCAIDGAGLVGCTGLNDRGQLGDNSIFDYRTSVGLVADAFDMTAVAVGGHSACALRADGTVWCWGAGSQGTIGDGLAVDQRTLRPVRGLTNATQITCGDAHCCALRADGTVWCWGHNGYGQIGDGTTANRFTPARARL